MNTVTLVQSYLKARCAALSSFPAPGLCYTKDRPLFRAVDAYPRYDVHSRFDSTSIAPGMSKVIRDFRRHLP